MLNLIRELQPISRADLARRMSVRRGTITPLVRELIESDVVFEKGTATTVRGRRPTMLCLRTRNRWVVAVDIRAGRSIIALSDIAGRIVERAEFETPATPDELPELLERALAALLHGHRPHSLTECEALAIVLPGMVDRKTGRLIYAPRLGWRDVNIRTAVSARVNMRVYVESAPIACALARLWLEPEASRVVKSFAYVSVSEGIGVGMVVNGEVLRGEQHTAGEFGHVSLDSAGPPCVCGKIGCWEAFSCNSATVDRYMARQEGIPAPRKTARARGGSVRGVADVVRRARSGEPAAIAALVETGHHIGRGLSVLVSAFNPGRIYLGGEITAGWEFIEAPIRDALAAGTISGLGRETVVVPDRSAAEYRLLGAVALVTASRYAALAVG